MSKYDPLWQYIDDTDGDDMELGFDAIESILGFPIDHSFLNYKKELEAYGYRVKKIHIKAKTVEFEKYAPV